MNNQIAQPTIYQINTAVFLHEQGNITLAEVSDETWDSIAALPIDMVWFMGIWQRSSYSKSFNENADWLKEALPDIQPDDVIGSAYSIVGYEVDERFGGDKALAVAREKLKQRGIKLMLDFVPNHVGVDHPWATDHPEYFLAGTPEELAEHPHSFFQTPSGIWANGKDPQFPAWADVLQLNSFSEPLRHAQIATLQKIAEQCDAVRCDMTMLMMNHVFQQTWRERAGHVPEEEYWPQLIGAVREVHPQLLFLAEAYWGLEHELIRQGFDFAYDKETYDTLVENNPHALRSHLKETEPYQRHLLRFIENHDEPRVAATLPFEQHKAAAVISLSLPGMRLIHDGQKDGRKIRVPVQLARRPQEPVDEPIAAFYNDLFERLKSAKVGTGTWQQEPLKSGLFNRGSHHVFAWNWQNDAGKTTVVVNYSDKPTKVALASGGKVQLAPWQYDVTTR